MNEDIKQFVNDFGEGSNQICWVKNTKVEGKEKIQAILMATGDCPQSVKNEICMDFFGFHGEEGRMLLDMPENERKAALKMAKLFAAKKEVERLEAEIQTDME